MEHIPVLLNETIQALNLKDNSIYVDATVGRGGHLDKILKSINNSKIIAVDKDFNNIKYLEEKYNINSSGFIKVENNYLRTVHSDYKYIEDILSFFNLSSVDGIIADLGFCSTQIEDKNRGFSFLKEAELDMRYDFTTNSKTAKTIVNEYSLDELINIFKDYAEEKFAKLIANKIITYRKIKQIKTTFDLADLIYNSVPKKFHGKTHPATKVFQALRIETNSELASLNIFLNKIPDLLNKDARVAIISFHSIEDRIVKNALNSFTLNCNCSNYFCNCGNNNKTLNKINKKPITPSNQEINLNPRSRSAKLRVYEKI